MEIWIDTINLAAIDQASRSGVLHGITSNPSILGKSTINPDATIAQLLQTPAARVAVQITECEDVRKAVDQAVRLAVLSPKIIIKVPVTHAGLEIMTELKNRNIPVLATTVYEPIQVLYAAKAGAEYIAPYLGRIETEGNCYKKTLDCMLSILARGGLRSKIMAACIRSKEMIEHCAAAGAQSITIPEPLIFDALTIPVANHDLVAFANDWRAGKAVQESMLFRN